MLEKIEEFITHLKASGRAASTATNYKYDLVRFYQWFQLFTDHTEIERITSLDILAYRDDLIRRGRSPATINRKLSVIRSFLQYGLEQKWIAENPVKPIRKLSVSQQTTRPKWLTKKEAFKVLRVVQERVQLAKLRGQTAWWKIAVRTQAQVYLMLYAGLRVREVCNLKVEDVILRDRSGKVAIYGKGKKYREVPLNQKIREAVGLWVEIKPTSAWLFPSPENKPISTRAVQNQLEEIGSQAGLELKLTPHRLRHTFGKSLIDNGQPLNVVATLMGHSDANTTLIYTRPGEQDLQRAVEDLGYV